MKKAIFSAPNAWEPYAEEVKVLQISDVPGYYRIQFYNGECVLASAESLTFL